MTDATTPFAISVPDAELDALRGRLREVRWLPEVAGSGWLYGIDLAFMQDLAAYWADEFDWRAIEGLLNGFPQFRTSLTAWNGESLGIHFVHRRSSRGDARPLMIQHGWPSSVYDFHKIIDALAEPGDSDAPAFHVIAPSLPGYGWSDIPTRAGLGPAAIADLWVTLMSRLGYGEFLYHGGDWGAAVGGQLALRHAERIGRMHLTASALAPGGAAARPQTEAERRFFVEEQEPYVRDDAAHRGIHGTKFQTMAFQLEDSPVGLLAWIVDKWWILADVMREEEKPPNSKRGGDLYRRFTKDELLATVALYWFTRTQSSAMRIYHEAMRPPEEVEAEVGGRVRLAEGERAEVPAGFVKLKRGTPLPPRSWCERAFPRCRALDGVRRGRSFPPRWRYRSCCSTTYGSSFG